jgi:hypothetical protein
MSNKDTGGPAYPSPRWEGWGSPQEGMTLRDYFAAKAMQYWLSYPINLEDADRCARNAYSMADAMLKAREQ